MTVPPVVDSPSISPVTTPPSSPQAGPSASPLSRPATVNHGKRPRIRGPTAPKTAVTYLIKDIEERKLQRAENKKTAEALLESTKKSSSETAQALNNIADAIKYMADSFKN